MRSFIGVSILTAVSAHWSKKNEAGPSYATGFFATPIVALPQKIKPVCTAPAVIPQRVEYTVSRPRMGNVVERTPPTYYLTQSPATVCPAGFTLNGDICTTSRAIIQSCPVGYSRHSGGCTKILTTPFVPICPQGTDTVQKESGIQGPSSAWCSLSLTPFPSADCTAETYATSEAHQTGTIRVRRPLDAHSTAVAEAAVHVRRLQAECSRKCEGPVHCERHSALCAGLPQPDVLALATRSTVHIQKTCTKVTSTALAFSCPDGTLQGRQCCVVTPVPPTPVCKALGDVSNCYLRQPVVPEHICPVGYDKQCLPGQTCRCVTTESAAFALSCPTGFDLNGDGCVRTTAYQIICPVGFSLQGDICTKIVSEPADCVFTVTYECDRSVPNHKCG